MDEATASVDVVTEEKISQILKESFKNSTVIAIAHRLKSIADFDRVLILDEGLVIEYDVPHLLLKNSESMFSKLVEATGAAQADDIKQMAQKSYNFRST